MSLKIGFSRQRAPRASISPRRFRQEPRGHSQLVMLLVRVNQDRQRLPMWQKRAEMWQKRGVFRTLRPLKSSLKMRPPPVTNPIAKPMLNHLTVRLPHRMKMTPHCAQQLGAPRKSRLGETPRAALLRPRTSLRKNPANRMSRPRRV